MIILKRKSKGRHKLPRFMPDHLLLVTAPIFSLYN